MVDFIKTPQGRSIAYSFKEGVSPTVVFLGGFMSDMEGSKATYLEEWAVARGQAFLRFDYSGHGQSSGQFIDGAIGDWAEDAFEAISALITGPVVLVGSSMGGWISLLLCKEMGERVAGFIGIAAAPDFTEDGFWASFNDEERQQLLSAGKVDVPSDYGDPYPITKRLIEEGRDNLVLRTPLFVDAPVRLLQGSEDASVTRETALRLFDHLDAQDLHLEFVRGEDHSFSSEQCLKILERAIEEVLKGQR